MSRSSVARSHGRPAKRCSNGSNSRQVSPSRNFAPRSTWRRSAAVFPGKIQKAAIECLRKKRLPIVAPGFARKSISYVRGSIAVGKLAIGQFVSELPILTELVGKVVRVEKYNSRFDLVPLPHPSGASPWHRIEPGKTLTKQALALIANHPAWIGRVETSQE